MTKVAVKRNLLAELKMTLQVALALVFAAPLAMIAGNAERGLNQEAPREIVAEWLRHIKTGRTEDAWNLTTRSDNAGWSADLTGLRHFDRIRPLRQLGNDDVVIVVSNPFQDNSGEPQVLYAVLLKRNGQWRIDRHVRVSPKEASYLMEGFRIHPLVKFDVLAEELVGDWRAPCLSLTLAADGTGVHVQTGPGPAKEPESIKWEVSGSTLLTRWVGGDKKWEVIWVDEDTFQVNYAPGHGESRLWTWHRSENQPPRSQSVPRQALKRQGSGEKDSIASSGIGSERVFSLSGDPTNRFIDLDTGRIVVPPVTLDLLDRQAVRDWAVKQKVDAVASLAPEVPGLLGYDLTVVRLSDPDWERASANELTRRLGKAQFWDLTMPTGYPLAQPVLIANTISTSTNQSRTYGFLTREGSVGILQFLDFKEDPGGWLKFRYKLIAGHDNTRLHQSERLQGQIGTSPALPDASQSGGALLTRSSTGDQAVSFGPVKVLPGMSIEEVKSRLREFYQMDYGWPDFESHRCSILLYAKPSAQGPPSAQSGKSPPAGKPLLEQGFIAYNAEGKIVRAWRSRGRFEQEGAPILAQSLVEAFRELAAEGNTRPQILIKQNSTEHTMLSFEFTGKVLQMYIDSPRGVPSVTLDEGFSTE